MTKNVHVRHVKRSRLPVLLFAIVAITVPAGLVLAWVSSEAVRVIPDRTPGVPAQPGPVGSWVFTHTVDVPPGMQIVERRIEAARSTTELAGTPPEWPPYCLVTVSQRQTHLPVPTGGEPITVGTLPATYVPRNQQDPDAAYGVFWRGPSGDHAQVLCHGGRSPTVDLARRVRFTTTPVKVPVRLERLPTGYRSGSIKLRPSQPHPIVSLTLTPIEDGNDSVGLVVFELPTLPPDRDGERVEISGQRGVLHPRPRQVCLKGSLVICAAEDAIDSVGNSNDWPPGARERVIETVQGLEVAARDSDTQSWFEGRRIFPD